MRSRKTAAARVGEATTAWAKVQANVKVKVRAKFRAKVRAKVRAGSPSRTIG
jgi:hypothetical protein